MPAEKVCARSATGADSPRKASARTFLKKLLARLTSCGAGILPSPAGAGRPHDSRRDGGVTSYQRNGNPQKTRMSTEPAPIGLGLAVLSCTAD